MATKLVYEEIETIVTVIVRRGAGNPLPICAECDSVIRDRIEEREDDGQPLCGDCYARLYAARDAEDARYVDGDARYDQAREDGRRW